MLFSLIQSSSAKVQDMKVYFKTPEQLTWEKMLCPDLSHDVLAYRSF